jgi:hypothetical protein
VSKGTLKQVAFKGNVDGAIDYNRVFQGTIANAAKGSENTIFYGVNSVSTSANDEEYGFNLTVNGKGSTTSDKFGGYILVENPNRKSFGIDIVVRDADENYGIRSQVKGGSGPANYAVYASNTSTIGTAGPEQQWGGYFEAAASGDPGTMTKFGIQTIAIGDGSTNYGANFYASGADLTNYGLYSMVDGPSGSIENVAVFGINSSSISAGGDSEYGGFFIVDAKGSPISTLKYGVRSIVDRSGATGYGVLSQVNGSDINNYGGYFGVSGTSGPDNYGV